MIQKGGLLKNVDNSGVYLVKCIGIFGGYKKRYAQVGQEILISVQKIRSKSKTTVKAKKGEILKAVVIRSKKNHARNSGLTFSFDSSVVSLLTSQGKPFGTKVKGIVAKELRKTRFLRVAALSTGLI